MGYIEKVKFYFDQLHERAKYKYGGDYEVGGRHIIIFILFWNDNRQVHVYMENGVLYPYFPEVA